MLSVLLAALEIAFSITNISSRERCRASSLCLLSVMSRHSVRRPMAVRSKSVSVEMRMFRDRQPSSSWMLRFSSTSWLSLSVSPRSERSPSSEEIGRPKTSGAGVARHPFGSRIHVHDRVMHIQHDPALIHAFDGGVAVDGAQFLRTPVEEPVQEPYAAQAECEWKQLQLRERVGVTEFHRQDSQREHRPDQCQAERADQQPAPLHQCVQQK